MKSIAHAHAKAHLFLLCEAGELNDAELEFLHRRGWETLRNPNGELLVRCRINGQGSEMTMLAGPTFVGVAHSHLPLTYMIVEIKYGMTLPHGSLGSQPSRDQVPKASLTEPLTRAGMDTISEENPVSHADACDHVYVRCCCTREGYASKPLSHV